MRATGEQGTSWDGPEEKAAQCSGTEGGRGGGGGQQGAEARLVVNGVHAFEMPSKALLYVRIIQRDMTDLAAKVRTPRVLERTVEIIEDYML